VLSSGDSVGSEEDLADGDSSGCDDSAGLVPTLPSVSTDGGGKGDFGVAKAS